MQCVFLTIHVPQDIEEPVEIHEALVVRVQPAIVIDFLLCVLLVIEIPHEYMTAPDTQIPDSFLDLLFHLCVGVQK